MEESGGGREEEMEKEKEKVRLSPAAQLFHAPRFNCHIIAVLGSNIPINAAIVKLGLQQSLIKHPRFSSKLVVKNRRMTWTPTFVNVEEHIIIPNLDEKTESSDQLVEDYISHLTTIPMDMTKPLWELHILNLQTSYAKAIGIFKIHHSMGDGASLMSLMLACTRKTCDPEALPTIPIQKRAASNIESSSMIWKLILGICMILKLVWNTLVDLSLFAATILFLKDTKTPLKGESGVDLKPKRIVYRSVSLDDIKIVKNKMKVTINDVILGITQAALSSFLHHEFDKNERNGKERLGKNIRLRATILVNLRPIVGIQSLSDLMEKESKGKWGWGNWIGYIMLPLNIALQDNPLHYIQKAKATIDRKKLSLEAICTFQIAKLIINILGAKVGGAIAHRFLSNTTLAFSNVVGPLEEVSFYGHPITFLAPTVYGHPHALTIHFQSYSNKMMIVIAVDPDVIPNPHKLCDHLEESLNIIKNAVVSDKELDAA